MNHETKGVNNETSLPRDHHIGFSRYVLLVLASVVIHLAGAVFIAAIGSTQISKKEDHVARVRLAPKVADTVPAPVPTPAPAPTPEPVQPTPPPPKKEPLKENPEKTRKARAREDERIKPEEVPPEPVEVRGGLSDSTALNQSNNALGPAVAQGNSAELAVDPSKGDLPPPKAVPSGTNTGEVDYSALAVEEAFAETAADCAGALPELELTDDAVNAGLTSGVLILEVIIDERGRVQQPQLVKGTGYAIDQIAVEAVKKMVCRPAEEKGQKTVVRKELRFEVVDF